jgi:uncharacterized repeat protein (TIGR02543 family)
MKYLRNSFVMTPQPFSTPARASRSQIRQLHMLWSLLVAALLLAPQNSRAALTGIPAASGMVTNDIVDWGLLGDAGRAGISIGNPFDITSSLGLGVNGSQDDGLFIRVDQDAADLTFTGGWDGNFLQGTHLIATLSGPVTLNFDPPVEAVGFQINGGIGPAGGADGSDGAFTATIQAFDTNGASISYSQNGINTDTADGSAKFIGVASDSANISSIIISESDASVNSGEFAIGPLNLHVFLTNNIVSGLPGTGSGNDFSDFYTFWFDQGSLLGTNDTNFWGSLDADQNNASVTTTLPMTSNYFGSGPFTNVTITSKLGIGIMGQVIGNLPAILPAVTNTVAFFVMVQLTYTDNSYEFSSNLFAPGVSGLYGGTPAGVSRATMNSYYQRAGVQCYLRRTSDSQSCQLPGTPLIWTGKGGVGPYLPSQVEGIVQFDTPFPCVGGGGTGDLALAQTNAFYVAFTNVPRGNYTFYATVLADPGTGLTDGTNYVTIKAEASFVIDAGFRDSSGVTIESPTNDATVKLGNPLPIHYHMGVDYPYYTLSWLTYALSVDGQTLTNKLFDWTNQAPVVDETVAWTPTTTGLHTIEVAGTDTRCGYYTNSVTVNVVSSTSDKTPPTIAIKSPTAGQFWSNSVFTVAGTASDNVGVVSVSYQLNGGSWTPATSANGYTNWTATLTLTPGTNTVKAYASDGSGNNSTNQTVSFVYVLSAPLSVSTVGSGTVSPNYNNALLQIGRSYSMTAAPSTGSKFTGWTGSQSTTNSTLTFTMASNLSFTASFADGSPPVLTIKTPTNGMNVAGAACSVVGTAKDNVGVTSVQYQLNGGDWSPASTSNNWTNWNISINLAAGTNTLKAYALDAAANSSKTQTVTFFYPLPALLSVIMVGRGTLTPNYNNHSLDIGRSYSMKAAASAGFKVTGWTGSQSTTNSTLTFIMASNLTFTANFADDSPPVLAIRTPTNGLNVTNVAFSMAGTAKDNVGVTSVQYQLNGGAWLPAYSSNSWTNWNVTVSLAAGTNIIKACALDAAGNTSKTQTVTFFYALPALLSASMQGHGTLTPNYNNYLLDIGRSYSMKAAASTGFKFTGWTGSQTTSNSTLTFIMASNLTFTANFADDGPPTLAITTPTNGMKVKNNAFTVVGTAKDNAAVAGVWWDLNNEGTMAATTTNNWLNWTANLELSPGTNVFTAYAIDTSSNYSATKTVSFVYAPPTGIDLYINPSDPLFMTVQDTNNKSASFHGIRDTNGNITGLTSMTVTDHAANTTTWLFDDQGRPSQLYTPSGDSVVFTWLTTTNFILTATSADGTIGLQVPGVLTNTTTASADTQVPGSSKDVAAGSGLPPRIDRLPSSSKDVGPLSQVVLTLTRCQQPVTDAHVTVSVVNAFGGQPIVATAAGNAYIANLPDPNAPTQNVTCSQIQNQFAGLCQTFIQPVEAVRSSDFVDQVCQLLSENAEQFPPVGVGAAVQLSGRVCDITEDISYLNYICNGAVCDQVNNMIDRGKQLANLTTYYINVQVEAPGAALRSYTFTQPAGSPVFSFSEDLPGDQSFTLSGPSPASINPGDTATVSVVTNCPGANLSLTWSPADSTIASVDGNGVVTGIAPGTTQILASETTDSGAQLVRAVSITVTSAPLAITNVSPFAPTGTQTITISGSGFGTQSPFDGDSAFLAIQDLTGNWEAGNAPDGNLVTVSVSSWTDNQIIISGFTGDYGISGGIYNWNFELGDYLTIEVWNPQSGQGPATYGIIVGSP